VPRAGVYKRTPEHNRNLVAARYAKGSYGHGPCHPNQDRALREIRAARAKLNDDKRKIKESQREPESRDSYNYENFGQPLPGYHPNPWFTDSENRKRCIEALGYCWWDKD
jgi:hypothetical protein